MLQKGWMSLEVKNSNITNEAIILLVFKSAGWRKGPDPHRGSWRGRLRSRLDSPIVQACWFTLWVRGGSVGGGTLPGAVTQAADNGHFVRTEACRRRSRPLRALTRCDRTLIGAVPLEVSDLFQRDREARRVLPAVTSRLLPRWNASDQRDVPAVVQALKSRRCVVAFALSQRIVFISHNSVASLDGFLCFYSNVSPIYLIYIIAFIKASI